MSPMISFLRALALLFSISLLAGYVWYSQEKSTPRVAASASAVVPPSVALQEEDALGPPEAIMLGTKSAIAFSARDVPSKPARFDSQPGQFAIPAASVVDRLPELEPAESRAIMAGSKYGPVFAAPQFGRLPPLSMSDAYGLLPEAGDLTEPKPPIQVTSEIARPKQMMAGSKNAPVSLVFDEVTTMMLATSVEGLLGNPSTSSRALQVERGDAFGAAETRAVQSHVKPGNPTTREEIATQMLGCEISLRGACRWRGPLVLMGEGILPQFAELPRCLVLGEAESKAGVPNRFETDGFWRFWNASTLPESVSLVHFSNFVKTMVDDNGLFGATEPGLLRVLISTSDIVLQGSQDWYYEEDIVIQPVLPRHTGPSLIAGDRMLVLVRTPRIRDSSRFSFRLGNDLIPAEARYSAILRWPSRALLQVEATFAFSAEAMVYTNILPNGHLPAGTPIIVKP